MNAATSSSTTAVVKRGCGEAGVREAESSRRGPDPPASTASLSDIEQDTVTIQTHQPGVRQLLNPRLCPMFLCLGREGEREAVGAGGWVDGEGAGRREAVGAE